MCLCDKPYTFYFYISSPCHLLIWLICLFVAGCLITGRILTISSRFYFYATIDKTTLKETIHPISVIRDLQLWKNYDRFSEMIENLSVKMKGTIRMGLYIDFLFMFFAYGSLYLLARWIAHCVIQTSLWPELWYLTRWLPLIAWIMDAIEDIFTMMLLANISKFKAHVQRLSSALKWIVVLLYIGIWAAYGISLLV